jgi:hypothetical protein
MQCAIYKSLSKQDTYLYMAVKDDFSGIPKNLLKLIGEPVHVMDLELHSDCRLAQEDIVEVLHNLQERGWHLQMPRREEWLETNVKH